MVLRGIWPKQQVFDLVLAVFTVKGLFYRGFGPVLAVSPDPLFEHFGAISGSGCVAPNSHVWSNITRCWSRAVLRGMARNTVKTGLLPWIQPIQGQIHGFWACFFEECT